MGEDRLPARADAYDEGAAPMTRPNRDTCEPGADDQAEAVVRRARGLFLLDLLANGTATADDVFDAVDRPPGVDPRCLGAVPGPLVRAGLIRAAGRVSSVRPGRHRALVRLWTLTDRAAALRFLIDLLGLGDADRGQAASTTSNDSINAPAPAVAAAGADTEA